MIKSVFFTLCFMSIGVTAPIINTTSSTNNKFVLITSLYNETDNRRIAEYLSCLNRNMKHPSIDTIHVVYDTSKDTTSNQIIDYLKAHPALTTSYVQGRPTFEFLFDLANTVYSGRKIIVSNADIYFDQSLTLLDNYNLTGKFLSLTRWNVLDTGKLHPIFLNHKHPCGADTWIFSSPIKKLENSNFGLGTWHCDFKLVYQAYKSKLTVLNPCIDIKCCHVHHSQIRHYTSEPTKDNLAWVRPGRLKDKKYKIISILGWKNGTALQKPLP